MKTELNQNPLIVLDFTAVHTEQQDCALMPAKLAKKLLKMYADRLVSASPRAIILPIIDELQGIINDDNNNDVERAVQACIQFVSERQLIKNCSIENWEAYSTVSQEPVVIGKIDVDLNNH